MFVGRSVVVALISISTLWFLYDVLHITGNSGVGAGVALLTFQAWAGFAFAATALTTTADSISKEKREGTLGLLFLTHLTGRDVVLGKLAATSTFWFGSALSALPLFVFPALLGGISMAQSINLSICILNTMFFSATAGLLASSLSISRQKAHSGAVGIVTFFCLGIPLLAAMARKIPLSPTQMHLLEMCSPFYTQTLALGMPIGIERIYFATSLAMVFGMSCVFLTAACWITPRVWQQRAREPLIVRWRAWVNHKTGQLIKSRSDLGRTLLDRNAYEWMAARDKSASSSAWTFMAGWVCLAAAILGIYGSRDWEAALMGVTVPIACLLQLSLKIRIGGHACDRFFTDRTGGGMELILCTPVSIRQMVNGEFRALRRRFLLLAILTCALLLLTFYLSLGGIDRLSGLFYMQGGESPFRMRGLVIALAFVSFVALDSWALIWAAMWCALRNLKNPRGTAVSLVLGSPVILFCLLAPPILESSYARSIADRAGFFVVSGIIFVLVCGVDLALIHYCRKQVLHHGREIVTTPEVHTRDLPTLFSSALSFIMRLVPKPIGKARAA